MTTHALSDTWLTDSLEWDNGAGWIDVPFLPGVPVRIQKRTVVQWDDRPRQGFTIWIGKDAESHSSVIAIGEGASMVMLCDQHENECDCRKIARQYMEATR